MATRTRGNIPATRSPPPSQLPQAGTIQHFRPHPSSSKIITSFAQNQDSTAISKQQSKRPTRRSTFDDPSSPSTTQNTRGWPNPTLRPSTLTTTQKTGPARKPSSLNTRPVSSGKKRFIYVKKQDIGTSAAARKEQLRSPPEKVEVSNAYDVPQPEQEPRHQESSSNEAKEEAIQVGSSIEHGTKADVLAQEDPELISNAQSKEENGKDVNLKTDKQDIALVVKTEAVSQVAETVSNINQEFSEAHDIDEISSSKTDDNVADKPTSEVGEMNKQPAKTLLSDEKEAGGNESEARESKETEAQEVGREEKRETENVAAKTKVSKGKKESALSNDVIEETASRLRGQRKNKVKALAGAFETVISLQEQK